MQNVRLISPNGVIEFILDPPPNSPYIFESLYGQGMPTRQPNETQGMMQIGATYHSDTTLPRDLDFGCYVFGESAHDLYQRRVFLNTVASTTDNGLRIEYINDYGEWYCYGTVTVVDYSPRIQLNVGHFQPIQLQVHCADPYWRYAQDPQHAHLAYQGGLFKFPFHMKDPPGIKFGAQGYTADAYNHGTASAPVEMWIRGPAERPSIENKTTGESFTLGLVLTPTQMLYVNTRQGGKQIQIIDLMTGVAATAWGAYEFAPGKRLWQLKPGANIIEYHNLDNENNHQTRVELRWEQLFTGV